MFDPLGRAAGAMLGGGRPNPAGGGGGLGSKVMANFNKQRQQQQAGQPAQPTLSPGQQPGAQPTPAAAPSPLAQAMQPQPAGRPYHAEPDADERGGPADGDMDDLRRQRAAFTPPMPQGGGGLQEVNRGEAITELARPAAAPAAPAGPQTADDYWGAQNQAPVLPQNVAAQQPQGGRGNVSPEQVAQWEAKNGDGRMIEMAQPDEDPRNNPAQRAADEWMNANSPAVTPEQQARSQQLAMESRLASKQSAMAAGQGGAGRGYSDMLQGIAAKQGSDRGVGAQLAGQMGQKPWGMMQGMQRPAAQQPWGMLKGMAGGGGGMMQKAQQPWNMLRR